MAARANNSSAVAKRTANASANASGIGMSVVLDANSFCPVHSLRVYCWKLGRACFTSNQNNVP
jgi:hypothetical protein